MLESEAIVINEKQLRRIIQNYLNSAFDKNIVIKVEMEKSPTIYTSGKHLGNALASLVLKETKRKSRKKYVR